MVLELGLSMHLAQLHSSLKKLSEQCKKLKAPKIQMTLLEHNMGK